MFSVFFNFFSALLLISAFAFSSNYSRCPKELQPILHKIEEVQEVALLLEKIQQDGPIGIEFNAHLTDDFEAMWDGQNRVIMIHRQRNQELGTLLSSLIFELHNASTNKTFMGLVELAKEGRIRKNEWVERVERMEHQNAVRTSKILEKGIRDQLFPANARWPMIEDFDDYYKLQQLTGHSLWLANTFDTLSPNFQGEPYHGTIPNLHRLSAHQKRDLLRSFQTRN